jgi:nucleoside 2-deoxyribosyltransferase
MKLYLAGPLMTTAERMFNAELARLLRLMGYEVFLPQESEQQNTESNAIFLSDVAGIDWCDVIVANMDGPDPDSGTCWECGYGFRKKSVVVYRTDIRSEGQPFGPYNLMLHQAATMVLDLRWLSVNRIAVDIDHALRTLP